MTIARTRLLAVLTVANVALGIACVSLATPTQKEPAWGLLACVLAIATCYGSAYMSTIDRCDDGYRLRAPVENRSLTGASAMR